MTEKTWPQLFGFIDSLSFHSKAFFSIIHFTALFFLMKNLIAAKEYDLNSEFVEADIETVLIQFCSHQLVVKNQQCQF